jgi:hypothetical protein
VIDIQEDKMKRILIGKISVLFYLIGFWSLIALAAHPTWASGPFTRTPDYDSGWIAITAGAAATRLYHNLGGDVDDYVVDMQYSSFGSGINQRYYGGTDFGPNAPGGTSENDRVGAYWRSLNTSYITVYRRPEDIYAYEIKIRIFKSRPPSQGHLPLLLLSD